MAFIVKTRSRKGGFLYYVRFNLGGSERWKSAGRTMEMAKRVKAKIENDLMNERYDLFVRKEPVTFRWYVDKKYLPSREKLRRYKNCDIYACKHLKYFFGDTLINNIDEATIRDYIAEKTGVLAPRTIHDHIATLNQIFRWAFDAGHISRNPIRKGALELPKIPKKNIYLSIEQFKALYLNSSLYLKAYITISYFTGMRKGEILHMQTSDIDFMKNTIRVRAENTKSKVEKIVPMTAVLRNQMLWLKDNVISPNRFTSALDNIVIPRDPRHVYIFCHEDGSRIKDVRGTFTRAVKRTGLPKEITPHKLRHTFVTHLLEAGKDLKVVSELAGHKDIRMTANIYGHTSQKHKQEVVNVLDEVASGIDFWVNGNDRREKRDISNLTLLPTGTEK